MVEVTAITPPHQHVWESSTLKPYDKLLYRCVINGCKVLVYANDLYAPTGVNVPDSELKWSLANHARR